MEAKTVTVSAQSEGRNMIVAYLLWWFLGWAGIHRFYLGKVGTGIAQLILVILGWLTVWFFIGFLFFAAWGVWWLLDAYFVQKHVSEINSRAGLPSSGFTFNTVQQGTGNLEQLEKLHSLYEKGVVTKQEYESKKNTLL